MNNICVSIGEEHFADLLTAIQTVDFAEIRLDLCKLNDEEIKQVFSLPKTFVATCREGFYNHTARAEQLKKAIAAGAHYVDIETEAPEAFREDLINYARKYSCKIIISYHNFENTPNLVSLNNIVNECRTQGADLVKLVSTAVTTQDSSRVLSLYGHHENIMAFAMGELGKITRLASLFLGAPFTYAAISKEKSVAGGQLTADTMRKMVTLFELK